MLIRTLVLAVSVFMLSATGAMAHFGMVIPNTPMVVEKDQAGIKFQINFSHPMELVGMDMAKPLQFGVSLDGENTDLLGSLKEIKVMDHKAWEGAYDVKKPGVYQFYAVPDPYWEPAEDCFIQHMTKVYVPAFGEEEGWDVPLGLKTEIVPLTRPFANYAGNVFRGIVMLDGKPVPGATVEVEYYNKDGAYKAPNEYFVTQTVMTDENGVFSYAVPWAGWWGFAALNTSNEKIKHEGQDKDVELGAVLWTEFSAPMKK
jgi:cobalt/nickel transport protein